MGISRRLFEVELQEGQHLGLKYCAVLRSSVALGNQRARTLGLAIRFEETVQHVVAPDRDRVGPDGALRDRSKPKASKRSDVYRSFEKFGSGDPLLQGTTTRPAIAWKTRGAVPGAPVPTQRRSCCTQSGSSRQAPAITRLQCSRSFSVMGRLRLDVNDGRRRRPPATHRRHAARQRRAARASGPCARQAAAGATKQRTNGWPRVRVFRVQFGQPRIELVLFALVQPAHCRNAGLERVARTGRLACSRARPAAAQRLGRAHLECFLVLDSHAPQAISLRTAASATVWGQTPIAWPPNS
jgi:hypothetical protein